MMSAKCITRFMGREMPLRCRVVKGIALVLAAAVFAAPLLSCKKEKKIETEKLVNVVVATALKKQVHPYLEVTGTLMPDEEITVSSEVDGIVRSVKVDEGSDIVPGKLLVEINPTDYLLDHKRAEAAWKQAEASLANVRAEYQRKDALYKEELITRQQYDDISTRVILAEADVAKAKAALDTAAERLARTKIYSPVRGMVKEKKISTGDFVRASFPLLQLIKIDPLKLNFAVSEKDISKIRDGQDVVFTVDSFADRQFKGKIKIVYPHLDERTRTLKAEAVVANGDRSLKPGLFARAVIYTARPRDAILVPLIALSYDGPTVKVFVVEDRIAKERIVKIGDKYGENVEILDGVREKEDVVVVGQNNLSDGVKVNVDR
ncbi:MAG TPA: efflux RND transporter periplasmic adaptor subunit [Smithella sp.]|nr:efflux RND transporter periplasmic adaptor subunit [Smithella sp.]HRS96637.1 efflux RND transporter periplasmic adaptor subunit [Smithella sp.]